MQENITPDQQTRRKYSEEQGTNRMFVIGKQNCFIWLKDHKPNFQNNPVTLLNPAKTELYPIKNHLRQN